MSNPKHRLAFSQLDVFTSEPLAGNQLAVFKDGRGLSDDQMLALAREMNFSETTFILPRDAATERERGVRVRIFTVDEELPFAGHPTLGTAMVIHAAHNVETVRLDLNAGIIPVRFQVRDGLLFGEMTQPAPEFGQLHALEDVARAAGLALSDIATDVPIQTVSTGNAFAIVPLKSLAVLQKLSVSWPVMRDYLQKTDAKFFYFISRETLNPGAQLQARMLFYNGEDPATGSAAGPCAAWAVHYGVVPPERQALIEQGVEMKRRSHIYITAGLDDGKVVNIRVAGHAVEVVQGEAFF
ncbi:MAG TPA: PhzF family phenazine biosynthesis protein [Candidatus Saccharimonadales bacterium]|jgi:trans-2,3-dihydro-3-hydroxyanthranilate isomerase|nr:PhzF family phenazine biosynthesis protein [Candidatus Saccharimonadales bacterium]